MNTTPDYDLMFLVSKRDMAEIDRNACAGKLQEARKIVHRLAFLDAPAHERVRAKHMVTCLERELEQHKEKLTGLRKEVSELDWSQA